MFVKDTQLEIRGRGIEIRICLHDTRRKTLHVVSLMLVFGILCCSVRDSLRTLLSVRHGYMASFSALRGWVYSASFLAM